LENISKKKKLCILAASLDLVTYPYWTAASLFEKKCWKWIFNLNFRSEIVFFDRFHPVEFFAAVAMIL